MSAPLRLLFVHGPASACWRAGFDVAQAAAALDVPVELGFAGEGLGLIRFVLDDAHGKRARGAYASLELLGIEVVNAPAAESGDTQAASVLPVSWLQPADWQAWLRRAPLQVW